MTRVKGRLRPDGAFPVVSDDDIKGGFRVLESIQNRNNLPRKKRRLGMWVFVRNIGGGNSALYQLINNPVTTTTVNADWLFLPVGATFPSGLTPKGTFDPNDTTLANGVGDNGDFYIARDSGSHDFGAGAIAFLAFDFAVYNGATYERISQNTLFNWDTLAGKPETFPPDPHGHVVADILDFPEGLENALTSLDVVNEINEITDGNKIPNVDAIRDYLPESPEALINQAKTEAIQAAEDFTVDYAFSKSEVTSLVAASKGVKFRVANLAGLAGIPNPQRYDEALVEDRSAIYIFDLDNTDTLVWQLFYYILNQDEKDRFDSLLTESGNLQRLFTANNVPPEFIYIDGSPIYTDTLFNEGDFFFQSNQTTFIVWEVQDDSGLDWVQISSGADGDIRKDFVNTFSTFFNIETIGFNDLSDTQNKIRFSLENGRLVINGDESSGNNRFSLTGGTSAAKGGIALTANDNTDVFGPDFYRVGVNKEGVYIDYPSAAQGDILIRNSDGYFVRVPKGTTGQILAAGATIPQYEDRLLSSPIVSSNEITFETLNTYGTFASPRTGAITASFTGAKRGVIQEVFYNNATLNIPSGWRVDNADSFEASVKCKLFINLEDATPASEVVSVTIQTLNNV
jgi:hypothetical protein